MTDRGHDVWYFAYGSNLCRGTMLSTEEEVAVAKGFAVSFNKNSQKWKFAANIVVAPRNKCKGVVYQLDKAQFERLRRSEKGYAPMCIEVVTGSGETRIARTFVALPEHTTNPGTPKPEYLSLVWEGGLEHSLPRRYLRCLMERARRSKDTA